MCLVLFTLSIAHLALYSSRRPTAGLPQWLGWTCRIPWNQICKANITNQNKIWKKVLYECMCMSMSTNQSLSTMILHVCKESQWLFIQLSMSRCRGTAWKVMVWNVLMPCAENLGSGCNVPPSGLVSYVTSCWTSKLKTFKEMHKKDMWNVWVRLLLYTFLLDSLQTLKGLPVPSNISHMPLLDETANAVTGQT